MCYFGDFLCPITAGEPLSYCNGACYSKFMYTCDNNVLSLLPAYTGPFTLSVSNPTLPIDGTPVSACGLHWWLGGSTCSYCPTPTVPPEDCPAGNETVLFSNSQMDVEVPGGQQYYLDAYWGVYITQAHSDEIPPGSTQGGFAAYQDGGFINMNTGALGWVACVDTAAGGGAPGNGADWNLVAKNTTNAPTLTGCTPVNLKVNPQPSGTVGAWQYT